MGNGTRRGVVLIAVLGLLVASVSPAVPVAVAQDVPPADDAYHFRYWADGRHDANYIEWWYFNLFDAQQNVQAVFTYFVADPANLTLYGVAQLVAVAYSPAGIVSVVDSYSSDSFSAAYDKADVQIGTSAIEVVDASTYRIVGATQDGRLSWDLTYVKESDAWAAADRITVGSVPWERMSWLVYMPRAAVSGKVTIDGQVYEVAASGYHDHNWGEWIFTDALWNWAQYSAPGFSFELGDFIGQPVGIASLDVQGRRTVFTKDQYRLVHTRWAYDGEDRQPYPVETLFVAEDPTTRLILTLRATATDTLRGEAPIPLPFPPPVAVIYEQTAEYDGWFQQKDPSGNWLPPVSFGGGGFKEYTARTWHGPASAGTQDAASRRPGPRAR
jgi:hypothetical protein